MTEEDIDRLDIELTHTIDICDFVSIDEIDPIFFRKAYYLLPQDGAEKPYRLLARALADTGRVAVAKVVIRNKQHLACVRSLDEALVLETMYYADEVRRPEEVPKRRGGAAEVEMAKTLIENLDGEWDPTPTTTATERAPRPARGKAKGEPLPKPEEAEEGEVVDLMEALGQSVAGRRRRRSRSAAQEGSSA